MFYFFRKDGSLSQQPRPQQGSSMNYLSLPSNNVPNFSMSLNALPDFLTATEMIDLDRDRSDFYDFLEFHVLNSQDFLY